VLHPTSLKSVVFGLCLGIVLIAGDAFSQSNDPTTAPESSVATAFLVAPNYLITAYHAVRGKQKLYVAPERDETFTAAEVVGFSEDLDVALIRASASGTILPIGQWSSFPRGAETYVIGFPKIGRLVSEKRINSGIYNGIQRFDNRQDWFQLSAEIHKGNSGSPVLSADGKVFGVISHKLDAQQIVQRYGDLPQNVNFALKSSKLIEFLKMYNVEAELSTFEPTEFKRPFEIFRDKQDGIYLLLGTGSD
jgi:serine protease Do